MSETSFGWAVPFMRAGYGGRGLTYVVIAGFSLWAIWSGGSAQGTESALARLQGTPGGFIVLGLIAAGLFAYFLWRVIDAVFDLEDYGTDAEGVVARLGMVITGAIHGALGVAALTVMMGSGSGGGSGVSDMTKQVMELPFGRLLVGVAGVATVGAGIYYLHKSWKETYREDLHANHFTVNWNWALKAGVAAQGVIVTIAGGFLTIAALRYDSSEAGGLGKVFDWLANQPFGQVIVVAICVGLLGFALFCFVNAAYRIVPRASEGDVETLAKRLKDKAS